MNSSARALKWGGVAAIVAALATAHAQNPDHRWTFNNTLADSGTSPTPSDAQLLDPDFNNLAGGGSTQTATSLTLAGGVNNQSNYIDLGPFLLSSAPGDVTIELWGTQQSAQNWGRVFDFGNRVGDNGEDYLFMSWSIGGNAAQDRVEWREVTPDIGGSRLLDNTNAPYTLGTEFHIAMNIRPGAGAGGATLVTWRSAPSGNTDLGAQRGSFETPNTLASLNDVNGWLGRSQWAGDATANATFNEMRIFYRNVTPAELEGYHDLGPDNLMHPDADGDGLPLWWEIANGLDDNSAAGVNGPSGDPDGDGADNATEFAAGTDPNDPLSNPNDTDADGLDDGWEIANLGGLGYSGTDDPDRDGADNESEETAGTNPLDASSFPDSDSDGLPDPYELAVWGDLVTADAASDFDGDTYSDLEEYQESTPPMDGSFSPGKAQLRHRWSFNSDLVDSVGGSNAQMLDADNNGATGGLSDLTTNPGQVRLFGGVNGQSNYVRLGNNLVGGTKHDLTIELWGTQYGVNNWSRVFSFGSGNGDVSSVLMEAWTRGTDPATSRIEWRSPQGFVDTNQGPAVFPLGVEHHIVVHLDSDGAGGTQVTLYKNPSGSPDLGAVVGTGFAQLSLADLKDAVNWLGRSQFGGDPTANASYNEMRIWNGLVNPKVLQKFHAQGPDDPSLLDTDGDCLPDFWELANGLDPNSAAGVNGAFGDPDGDTYINRDEYRLCFDPQDPTSNPDDSDSDGLLDTWEIANFGDLSQTADGDPDRDHVSNNYEEETGTDPNDPNSFANTDGDSLPDGYEIDNFGDLVTSDGSQDTDGDTYTDLEELLANTPPNNAAFSPVKAQLRHRWSFNGNLIDSVGGSDAQLLDPNANPAVGGGSDLTTNPGEVRLFGGVNAESDYVLLGQHLVGGTKHDLTVELWGTQHGVANWTRVFSFGSGNGDVTSVLMEAWTRGTNINESRIEWRSPQFVIDTNETPAVYPLGVEHHIVVEFDEDGAGGTQVTLYKNPSANADLGPIVGTAHAGLTLVDLVDNVNWLGRSQFGGDPTANASYDEVRIWNGRLHPKVREQLHDQGPDAVVIVDTDGDCLPDFWESAHGLNASSAAGADGAFGDPDGDGFNNRDEYAACSDPNDPASTPDDTDADGLPDSWELANFGNLAQDGSGDPDGDCDNNLTEFQAGTLPNDNGSFTDSDNDFLPDAWEIKHFGSLAQDGGSDLDEGVGDGVSNFDEYFNGTDPNLIDTDGDGLSDGVESNFRFWNGTADTGTDPLNPDTDGDGLSDGVENPDLPFVDANQPGTDPNFFDTDFDGFGDGIEVANGSDPTNPSSIPLLIWHWDYTTLASGPVTDWVDKNRGVSARVLGADHGDPSKDGEGVVFDGNDALTIPDASNPVANLNAWTATVVFCADGTLGEGGSTRAGGAPNDPEQWWSNSPLVGVELPGNPLPSDWGIFLNSESEAVIGSGGGGVPQGFLADGVAYNDGTPHVMTGVFDVFTGSRTLYIDGAVVGNQGGVSVNPPGGPVHFGVNIPNVPADRAYYTGRIKEVLLHSVALDAAAVAVLAEELLATGGIAGLVDVNFNAGANTVTLTYAGLAAGSDYHVRVSTNGQTFTPVVGAEFNAATSGGTFQFSSDEQVTPLQIFKLYSGQIP